MVEDIEIPVNEPTDRQKIEELSNRVAYLELRLDTIAKALSTLMANNATELMSAVGGMKVYNAVVVTDGKDINDKTFHCTRTEDKINITCEGKELDMDRLPSSAKVAVQKALDSAPQVALFYVNLFAMG